MMIDLEKQNNLEEFAIFRQMIKNKFSAHQLPCITVSAGTCGQACGANEIIRGIKREFIKHNLQNKVDIKITGCHGFCEMEPLVVIEPSGIFYKKVTIKDVPNIVSSAVFPEKITKKLLYKDPKTKKSIKYQKDIPFYKEQCRTLLGKSEKIDPIRISNYILEGGYLAFEKVLKDYNPEKIIKTVKDSKLRGRGGAGFSTGQKWELCYKQDSPTKYIICNADEGDPGAYMDRSLLEGNPHIVIEGMIIGGLAMKATEGIVYVRHEYPLAVQHITIAIDQAREMGILGENILGTSHNFDIKIVTGAGAFVCGEETALISSIEGRMGEPKQKPPFPATKGLWGKPTNINNVETWANIPGIILEGAKKFTEIGTKNSTGTKIFSLVGKIKNTGLVEVPMGISIKKVVYDIGGGHPEDGKIKAVQTGGPSGGCIPEKLFDLPIDYDSLAKAGSIMGSGGMIVMDEETCMVDVAKYFLNFLKDESCGKCYSCRKGIQRLLEIVTDVTLGKATIEDLDLLEELANVVQDSTQCGLGQTASNPVLSTLRYFKDEYQKHIVDKKCPAGVCKELIEYKISSKECNGCSLCKKVCPEKAIEGKPKKLHKIILTKCTKCGTCIEVCNVKAIKKI